MHELSIMEEILRLAAAQLHARAGTRVHGLTVRIGALSGVIRGPLEFAFEALVPGTPAEGATLTIEEVPVTCYCPACAREFPAEPGCYICPACGRSSCEMRRGRELELVNMEIS